MQSNFLNNLMVDKRQALKLFGGAGAAATASSSLAFGMGGIAATGGLDYDDPYDNLYAFGKIWSGYGEPVIGAFHGLMYARFGDQRMVPIFGYAGTGCLRC